MGVNINHGYSNQAFSFQVLYVEFIHTKGISDFDKWIWNIWGGRRSHETALNIGSADGPNPSLLRYFWEWVMFRRDGPWSFRSMRPPVPWEEQPSFAGGHDNVPSPLASRVARASSRPGLSSPRDTVPSKITLLCPLPSWLAEQTPFSASPNLSIFP